MEQNGAGLMNNRWACRLALACAVLGTLVVAAPNASALIGTTASGNRISVELKTGVSPASIPGSIAARRGVNALSSNGNMDYNGGPVVHSMSPYLIFWVPSGETLSTTTQTLITRYFTDTAHDSGLATNIYGVLRQYTDSTGVADYQQTFSAGSQAILDTQAYPTTGRCTSTSGSYPTCLTDTQIQTEISRLITADALPTDGTNSSQLPANAPQYYVVLPADVNECSGGTSCASNAFCAYHGAYMNGSNIVLYAAMPTLLDSSDPKGCQDDGNTQVQKPNGDQVGDVFIKALSHEQSETISDPLLNAWWDTATGQEIGDNCNFAGSFDPGNGTNPNAFLPALGGTASAGTLFNQSDNSNPYYIQSEWSNGDVNCEMKPSTGSISPAFVATPSGGNGVSFDPTTSTSTAGFTSESWTFGDGGTSFSRSAPSSVAHTFATGGTYTVALTLVDTLGNTSTVSHQITLGSAPLAAFTFSPATAAPGSNVSFDASGSSDPNSGGSITSYAWDFGDGTTGTGESPSHAYANSGHYTVALRVTDNFGLTSVVTSHQVTVASPPTAAFSFSPSSPTPGTVVSFSGSGSSDPNPGGSITSYAWNFGDGTTAGGVSPSHTYSGAGSYTVTLKVTDNLGVTSSVDSQTVSVDEAPTAAFSMNTAKVPTGEAVSFNGSASSDPDGTIGAYGWNFGDGATGAGATTSHAFARPGTYTVFLGIIDSAGHTASISHAVTVTEAVITKVAVKHKTAKGASIVVTVNAPGRVSAGGKSKSSAGPAAVTLKIKLSKSQQQKLASNGKLTLHLKVTFVPTAGSAQTRKLTIKFKP